MESSGTAYNGSRGTRSRHDDSGGTPAGTLTDARESEVRFRFTNSAAVRDVFPRDIGERTLFVVDTADDGEADYEVRLIGLNNPGYGALRPLDTYEYRII